MIQSDNTYSETQAIIGMFSMCVMAISGGLLFMIAVCAS